jgi:hypothetical protein
VGSIPIARSINPPNQVHDVLARLMKITRRELILGLPVGISARKALAQGVS